mmetsp:Transcript_2817/g.7022  ORF Transcript_2817/g.7022 Transcript_2817/m.7022 type:complete len:129 (+) Transcript_2817:222-608(+)
MRDVAGFVVMVSGAIAGLGYVWWLFEPLLPGAARSGDEGSAAPDVYFALIGPIMVAVLLLFTMILYGLLNMASQPAVDDWRTIVDRHGAARRHVHGNACWDLVHDTPFMTDLAPGQSSSLLYRRAGSA